uniref:Uncharacterized protein n=1 Tax=Octactis speculum TaxID=3111310 RepID=A0A7S2AMY4_9STRA|mmetsp:Transcript_12897/g.16981  ORF Transcript_12897/g.16981 Transcript_12897/m.16981 type:complete len:112 (+) Transcript_12897:314-649(+)
MVSYIPRSAASLDSPIWPSKIEASNLISGSLFRPGDAHFSHRGQGGFAADFRALGGYIPSYQLASIEILFELFEDREQEKKNKYLMICERNQVSFMPCVIECCWRDGLFST